MYLDSLEAVWGTNRLYLKVGLSGVVGIYWNLEQNIAEVQKEGGINMVVNLHQLVHWNYTAASAQ